MVFINQIANTINGIKIFCKNLIIYNIASVGGYCNYAMYVSIPLNIIIHIYPQPTLCFLLCNKHITFMVFFFVFFIIYTYIYIYNKQVLKYLVCKSL